MNLEDSILAFRNHSRFSRFFYLVLLFSCLVNTIWFSFPHLKHPEVSRDSNSYEVTLPMGFHLGPLHCCGQWCFQGTTHGNGGWQLQGLIGILSKWEKLYSLTSNCMLWSFASISGQAVRCTRQDICWKSKCSNLSTNEMRGFNIIAWV